MDKTIAVRLPIERPYTLAAEQEAATLGRLDGRAGRNPRELYARTSNLWRIYVRAYRKAADLDADV